MSDEISKFGTGERGTFKLERPEIERPAKYDPALLSKEIERGEWWRNPRTKMLELFRRKSKPRIHAVHQDTLKDTEAVPVTPDGFQTESRSARERYYREHGYRSISTKELRQEWAKQAEEKRKANQFNMQQHREHWEQAGRDVEYGNVALTELEKEACRREERYLRERRKGTRSDLFEERLAKDDQTVTVQK